MSRTLIKATSLFASNTFLSRVLGLLRDMVTAQLFGAHAELDAFLVAFRLPNFMRRLFAEGAFSQAFIPVLSEQKRLHSHETAKQFIADMMGGLAAVLFIVTMLGVLFAPAVIHLFAPGFSAERFHLACGMLRITFPYLFFVSIVALCGAVLNTYGVFGIPAFTPSLLNISMIACAFYLSAFLKIPIQSLAWGVFIAGIIQLAFLLPFLYQKNLLAVPRLNFSNPAVRRVLVLMGPAIIGVSVAQINLLVDTIFASFLQVGSVSWLYLSDRLLQFPMGIFGVAISTVVLPHLSHHVAGSDKARYSRTLDWGLRLLFLVGTPASVGLFILAGPLFCALFQYKAFDAYAVLMSRESLMIFSLGLQSFMLAKVLASAFYAHQDIKTPVKIAIICMLTNIVLNSAFVFPLKHVGVALATSLSGILNVILLWKGLQKKRIYQPQDGWYKYYQRLIVANGVMGSFLYLADGRLTVWMQHGALWRLSYLGFLVVGGGGIYFVCLYMLGFRLKTFIKAEEN